jgi:hypothetical protein
MHGTVERRECRALRVEHGGADRQIPLCRHGGRRSDAIASLPADLESLQERHVRLEGMRPARVTARAEERVDFRIRR